MFYANTIPLVADEILPQFIREVLIGFQKTNSKNLLIQSNGGYAESLLWALNPLRRRQISTIGIGVVGSLAVAIFVCGKRRLAFPDTEFFIHQCGYTSNGERITSSLAQIKALICREKNNQKGFDFWQQISVTCKMMDEMMIRLISSRTSIAPDIAGYFLEKEKTFSTEEAMRCGLIHGIIYPEEVALMPEFGVYQPW
ncbi:MAG TPA: hypothetical protein ENJ27_01370 [Candidatus Moranbacteria bacterium]|nr:hypothetical protein [Candidatus Moranbacteria bacterium]